MSSEGIVLVVDDEKDIRDTLQEALEGEGYTVYTAANGREALDLLPSIPSPSLILLDLMMPVMDGWEFLKEMGENFTLTGIPVVIITAFGEKARTISQAQAVIRKPFDLNTLTETVRQYCG